MMLFSQMKRTMRVIVINCLLRGIVLITLTLSVSKRMLIR